MKITQENFPNCPEVPEEPQSTQPKLFELAQFDGCSWKFFGCWPPTETLDSLEETLENLGKKIPFEPTDPLRGGEVSKLGMEESQKIRTGAGCQN